jgi:hypothetical protein
MVGYGGDRGAISLVRVYVTPPPLVWAVVGRSKKNCLSLRVHKPHRRDVKRFCTACIKIRPCQTDENQKIKMKNARRGSQRILG